MTFGFAFAPLVPWPVLIALAGLAALLAVVLAFARPRGASFRAVALTLLILALSNPSLTREERERLPNVLAVVVDKSASQKIDGRAERTAAALADVTERAKALTGTELRTIEVTGQGSDGTELFKALTTGLADVPPDRVAGAVLITDGLVHDIPANAGELGFRAPVHALITGRPDERDRRVALVTTPRFGIVGKPQVVTFRVEETGDLSGGAPVPVTVRRDGQDIARLSVRPGQLGRVSIPIAHAGANIVEIEAAVAPGELTEVNNRAALAIEGVREKLRVLLVSGEPHSGERTWRNLLKADASVDLVHFTILRPPEKQDGTPINELSLIAFPTRELFSQKIDEFDLIIFDRYSRQGILPMLYFDNIAQYVRKGGAVLVAAGPDYARPGSLSETPLGSVLPAEPTGPVLERAFKPMVTTAGAKHPVTRDLPGNAADPSWSHWFRVVDTRLNRGTAVMSGASERPLLVLDRQEKGRVALFLSDHVWLWARGFEGGGPHQDLLRRLAHWLMKEPELDEEALRLSARNGQLEIERQTMADAARPVTLTLPSGQTRQVTLAQSSPGLFKAALDTGEMGLHRATDGILTALVNVGPVNPREFQELASTPERLKPLAEATGGTSRRVVTAGGVLEMPRLVAVSSSARAFGSDWIGVRQPEASVVRGLSIMPLFAGVLGLALLIGALALTWAREGR